MTSDDTDRYGERMFRPQESGESDRIDLGALAYDEVTAARLRELGVGPGWHCLDVGAGTGTVARGLLRQAGVARVLAVDRDVRFLAADPLPGLELAEADITAPDFTPGQFQLVHARFVLMHLPEPQRMVSRLSALVAPGGVLVLSDAVDLTSAVTPPTPYTRVMHAMWQGAQGDHRHRRVLGSPVPAAPATGGPDRARSRDAVRPEWGDCCCVGRHDRSEGRCRKTTRVRAPGARSPRTPGRRPARTIRQS